MVLDQTAKYVVVQTMYIGDSISVIGDLLRLTYTENPGMAFGITIGPPGLITVFALLATLLILVYLVRLGDRGYAPYRAGLAFVLGGAVGNIIDRVFYGPLMGYGDFFHGRVVDFIHVNLWRGYVPESIPLLGGNYIALFPIWNVADMAIVGGMIGVFVFQRRFHDSIHEPESESRDQAERDGESDEKDAHSGQVTTHGI